MARIGDVYGGNSLKAEDLGNATPVVTIEEISIREMDDGKRKAILHFAGKEKTLVLNVTNASIIEGITGTDEMDAWAGTRIQLYVDRNVMYQGRRTSGIRVRAPRATQAAAPPPPPVQHQPVTEELMDSDIPF